MKLIPLSKGYYTKVSDKDYNQLSKFEWCYGNGYAVRSSERDENNKQKGYKMHRVILDAPEGVHVDHKNGDKLDNRRSNLRLCNDSQNQANARFSTRNRSGYRGVVWRKSRQIWIAQIYVKNKQIYLGSSHNKAEAAEMYDQAARKYFKGFARPNFPEKK